MTTINQALLNVENSVFGVAVFSQDVFTSHITDPLRSGIYYTKIFQKNSGEIWNRVAWLDNQIKNGNNSTFDKMKIEVRIRTGNKLPIKDFSTNTRYTIDEINSIIETNPIDVVDSIFERSMLNRAVISDIDYSEVTSSNINYERLGTSYNSFRLVSSSGISAGVSSLGTEDTVWNYWSLPIINTPSYIPNNIDYDYLQARIWLQSDDNITLPKMFRINFSSVLKSTYVSTSSLQI